MTRLRVAGYTGFFATLISLGFGVEPLLSAVIGLATFLLVIGVSFVAEILMDELS